MICEFCGGKVSVVSGERGIGKGEEMNEDVLAPVLGSAKKDEWRLAAICLGEMIGYVGQVGYYEFSPHEWQRWATMEIRTAIAQAREEGRRAGLEEAEKAVSEACRICGGSGYVSCSGHGCQNEDECRMLCPVELSEPCGNCDSILSSISALKDKKP